ncbi:hypothetical protein ACLB1E_35385 [Escherichia coli]
MGDRVLFHLRDAFRSGDVWLTRSRRYGDLNTYSFRHNPSRKAVVSLCHCGRRNGWQTGKLADMRLRELGRAARAGTIPAA